MVHPNLIFFLTITLLITIAYSTQCHYTCFTCQSSAYTSCTSCSQGQLLVLKDPNIIPAQYQTSDNEEGVCLDFNPSYDYLNALGLPLLIISLAVLPVANTNKLFYLISTLQSIGLIGLIQVYWGDGEAYEFNALHYYMPFNLINRIFKTETLEFKQRSSYNLDHYFITPSILSSLNFIGIITIILTLLLILIPLIRKLKRKFCEGTCRTTICTEWFLEKAIKTTTTLFYFTIQQSMLCLVVALQYSDPISGLTIGLTVFYLILVILFCIYTYKIKIPYFPNKIFQYHSISKKLIYPIFLIAPPSDQYILIVMMLINLVLQLIFDKITKTYKFKSIYTIYRFNQILLLVFFLVYVIVEKYSNDKLTSDVLGGITLGLLNLMILWIIVEAVLGIKKRFFEGVAKKVTNSHGSEIKQETMQNIEMVRQNTEQNILDAFTKNQREHYDVVAEQVSKPEKPEEQKSERNAKKELQEYEDIKMSDDKSEVKKKARKMDKLKKSRLQKVYGKG